MPVPPSPRSARPVNSGVRPDRDLSRPLPAALSWSALIAFSGAFAVTTTLLDVPLWLPALYAVMSVITFLTYAWDKSAARRDRRRVPEQTLLTLGFLGGWPGALIAQQSLRHKTRKRTFRRAFWARVVLNVVLLSAIIVVTTLWGWDAAAGWNRFVSVLS